MNVKIEKGEMAFREVRRVELVLRIEQCTPKPLYADDTTFKAPHDAHI